MNSGLQALQDRLGYIFRDPALLERALTHSSFLTEPEARGTSNERLEFLGDAVLQLALTEALYSIYPEEPEGVLTGRRAELARGRSLVQLAVELELGPLLRLGASEAASGGRERASTLEDALEALLGAVFLEGGFAIARDLVLRLYGPLPDRLAAPGTPANPKGQLQERVQPLHGNNALRYEVVATAGKDHARSYEVAVFLFDRQLATGRGQSKKTAEEAAALAALPVISDLL